MENIGNIYSLKENQLIDDCNKLVMQLLDEAGKIVIEGFNLATKKVETKLSNWDVVTEYDRRIEQLFIDGILNKYPDHKFIAEESAAENQLEDKPTWIIDPIDGTNNFIHGIPLIAISIAFVLRTEVVLGIIYNPIDGELYRARKGYGAFLNDKPIRCSKVEKLCDAVYAHEVSFIRAEQVRVKNIKRVFKIASCAQGFRSFGACAISLAYLARGMIDGYEVSDLYPWDVAAGSLIITEAGGYICSPDGGKFDFMKKHLLAAGTKKLCQELVAAIKEADGWTFTIE